MILDVLLYLAVFVLTAALIFLFQKTSNSIHINLGLMRKQRVLKTVIYVTFGCLSIFPIIAMFGLRYGIGTDYFAYEQIFDTLHTSSFAEYWTLHNQGIGDYYIEPLYYALNKLFPSYRLLQWGLGILIFSLFFIGVKEYSKRLSFPFALFIFLATQFIYSMNGVRFVVALGFLLIAYNALAQNKTIKFIIIILVGALFHKAILICLAMIFLKKYKFKGVNSARNLILFVAIISLPFVGGVFFRLAGNIPFFSRYFETSLYAASSNMSFSFSWIFHVLPVFLPLLLVARKEIFDAEDTKTFFRICIMEIPFRMIGLYNTFYTRFARCSQIAQFVFIPLVVRKIENKKKRRVVYAYYIIWYIFYFAYYAIVNDNGDSLPYVWIFTN